MLRLNASKNWTAILSAAAAAVVITATACYQIGLWTTETLSFPPAPIADIRPYPKAAALAAELERRKNVLTAADRLNFPDDAEDAGSKAVYVLRPALKLRGVITSGRWRCASVSVEGEQNVRIVFQGQSVSDVLFREISQAGALCRWRGVDFFVPLEP